MDLLSGLLRPHARWLAMLAFLPLLAGYVAIDGGGQPDTRIVLVAERARTAALPTAAAAPRLVAAAPGSRPVASSPATPQLHRSDCRRSRAPPLA